MNPNSESKMPPQPIPVQILRFVEPMDAVGLSVASSASVTTKSNRTRFAIWYMPWIRHFRL